MSKTIPERKFRQTTTTQDIRAAAENIRAVAEASRKFPGRARVDASTVTDCAPEVGVPQQPDYTRNIWWVRRNDRHQSFLDEVLGEPTEPQMKSAYGAGSYILCPCEKTTRQPIPGLDRVINIECAVPHSVAPGGPTSIPVVDTWKGVIKYAIDQTARTTELILLDQREQRDARANLRVALISCFAPIVSAWFLRKTVLPPPPSSTPAHEGTKA